MCTGWVHSIQSLGAVDGPGMRSVVFMQGCPLRCLYCHNPDTLSFSGGQEYTPTQLVHKLLRFRPYWGENGGVTISGGEPLAQSAFVAQVFALLKEAGVHTALDTAGTGELTAARAVLQHTSLALVDIKAPSTHGFSQICGGDLQATLRFLDLTQEMGVPIWVRHVLVPGINATTENMRAVQNLAQAYTNLEKIEWLPFHNTCEPKYENMGIPFPLAGTPSLTESELAALLQAL
ncbi:pyruvate formate lyase-activating protein [Ruminococcaceae bacterium OttesenSCG-928-N02]|nr:pyruvate formate lyase-activating protein [Ruminococcaceae bacterium OttesenSCG-928-N02]